MTRVWTAAELQAAVAGKEIRMAEATGGDMPVPSWLLESSAGLSFYDSLSGIEATHPEDRGKVLAAFLAAIAAPGEIQHVDLRLDYKGSWFRSSFTMLSLEDLDGGVLMIHELGDPVVVAEVEINDGGEQAVTDWMVVTIDATGSIRSLEGRPLELMGYAAEEMIGRSLTEFMRPESMAGSVMLWMALHNDPEITQTAVRPFVRKDGTEVWLEVSYVHRGEAPAGEGHVFAVMFDVTERRERETKLQSLAAELRLMADEVPIPVFRCDRQATVTFGNVRWDDLLRSRPGVEGLNGLLSQPAWDALSELLEELGEASDSVARTLEVDAADGESTWRLRLRPLGGAPDPDRSFMGSLEDITATKRLHRQAMSDPLTGLANRAAIDSAIAEAVSEGSADVVVVFIDLDGFKPVNDTYGHDAGDRVLTEVARRLQEVVRPSDLVGRYGGDEFVVVYRSVPDDAIVSALRERLELALGGWIDLGQGRTWHVAASFGVARLQPDDDATTLLHRADQEMYAAKGTRTAVIDGTPARHHPPVQPADGR